MSLMRSSKGRLSHTTSGLVGAFTYCRDPLVSVDSSAFKIYLFHLNNCHVRSLLRIKQRQMIHEQQHRMNHPSAGGGSTSGTTSGPLGGRPAAEVAAEQRRGWWDLPQQQQSRSSSQADGAHFGGLGSTTSGITGGAGEGQLNRSLGGRFSPPPRGSPPSPAASAGRGSFSEDGELRMDEGGVLSSSSSAWNPAVGAAAKRPGAATASGRGAKAGGKEGDPWLVITDDEPS